jgi:hypothetical protein
MMTTNRQYIDGNSLGPYVFIAGLERAAALVFPPNETKICRDTAK